MLTIKIKHDLWFVVLVILFKLLITQPVFAAKLTVPDNLIDNRTLYLVPQSSAPASPVQGQVYYNNNDNQLYYYCGSCSESGWKVISAGSGPGGGEKYVATKIVAAYNSLGSTRDGIPTGPACLGDGSTCSNPKADYTCDGVSDETTIQQAIDALGSTGTGGKTGGVVYLLEGAYNIVNSIMLDDGTLDLINDSGKAIIGTGRATVLKFIGPGGAIEPKLINVKTVAEILISQLKISSSIGVSYLTGIYFDTVTNSKIDKVWVEGSGATIYWPISLSSSSGNTILNNFVSKAWFSENILLSSSNNNIISNNMSSNGGIHLYSSSNNIISGNNSTIGGGGIWLEKSSNSNTVFSNNLYPYGIQLYDGPYQTDPPSNYNTVCGNNLLGTSAFEWTIRLVGASFNSISGNNVATGIWFYSPGSTNANNNNIVAGNLVLDKYGTGGIISYTWDSYNLFSSNLLFSSILNINTWGINLYDVNCLDNYIFGNLIDGFSLSITDLGTHTKYFQKEKITIERQAVTVSSNGTLEAAVFPRGYVFFDTNKNLILNGTNAIADGKAVGDMLILEGSTRGSVTINDGANVQLSDGVASIKLEKEDTLTLIWNGTDWIETAYADN